MNKIDIVRELDKEVGLFHKTEDENSLGDLYATDLEFKKIQEILEQLDARRKEVEDRIQLLHRIIDGNERFTVIKDSELYLKDKTINLTEPLIFLGGLAVMNSCAFIQQK